jgi:hypothetical protein
MTSGDDMIGAIRRLAEGAGGRTSWQPAGGRVSAGEVIVDSASTTFEALRSAGLVEARQLVIRAGDHTVVLDIVEAPPVGDEPHRLVRGRIDGPGVCALQVVTDTGIELALATPDEFGDFEFDVPAGRWTLVVADDRSDVEIPVDLG